MDLKLEVIVIPVADTDRSKGFYQGLGFRLDADYSTPRGLRVVQVTPPGSQASVIFGEKLTEQAPGTATGLHLIVTDLPEAIAWLRERGAEVTGPWHDADGIFHWGDGSNHVDGMNPDADSYGSFASFADPDGNRWTLQQVVTRAPGRD